MNTDAFFRILDPIVYALFFIMSVLTLIRLIKKNNRSGYENGFMWGSALAIAGTLLRFIAWAGDRIF